MLLYVLIYKGYTKQVQCSPPAVDKYNPNQIRQIVPVGDGFGFILFLENDCFLNGIYTIALDGSWGSGKTFFIKQIELIYHKLRWQML
ncbi:MAG: P-loop NTPase fold protein [Eubacteriales bacterium]